MSVVGRTRQQLATSVGRNLAGQRFIALTATSTGTTTTFVDAALQGGNDSYNGWWIKFTGPTNNNGTIKRVSDHTGSSGTITWVGAITATATSDTAELWPPDFPPDSINEYINQAIIEATGRYYDPEESVALHSWYKQTRYDIPTEFAMLERVMYRSGEHYKLVHDCNRTFDETTDADFTQVMDDEDYRQANGSLRFAVVAAASAGDFVTDSITSVDLSGMTHLEFWVKSTVALTAADFVIRLDSGVVAGDATDLEILSVPAVSADVWTFCRVALASPRLDTAIVSIGIEYNVDIGAVTVWFDDFRAVNNDTGRWYEWPQRLWHIDSEARDLIIDHPGSLGYHLLKLIGGDKPALPTSESAATEVPDDFIIASATLKGILAAPDAPINNAGAMAYWNGEYRRTKAAFPMMQGVRRVD